MRKHNLWLMSALLALVFSACNRNTVFSEYKTFSDNQWPASEKAVFETEITDTLSLNNISLMLRHADSYPFSNIYLFVTTHYPDLKVITDTMELVLANQKGQWLGSGMGDIYDYKVPVKKNVRFPLGGKYRFEFQHGMRMDPLPMVMDFGFEIQKSR